MLFSGNAIAGGYRRCSFLDSALPSHLVRSFGDKGLIASILLDFTAVDDLRRVPTRIHVHAVPPIDIEKIVFQAPLRETFFRSSLSIFFFPLVFPSRRRSTMSFMA